MIYGLDAAYAPTATAARSQFKLGWQFYCGYIGGRAENVWTPDEWRRVRDAGFKLLPIWVSPSAQSLPTYTNGTDAGNQALVAMQQLGFAGNVALDIENGEVLLDYTQGFADSIHAGSAGLVLYGSRNTIVRLEQFADAAWLAQYVTPGASLQQAPPDWSMWQYATGPIVDYNVAVDDFPFSNLS